MTSKKKLLSMLIAAALVLAMLSPIVYIAAESGHDCIGDGCEICCRINACCDTLRILSLAVCAAAFAAALIRALSSLTSFCTKSCGSYTLVSLKVKLSD